MEVDTRPNSPEDQMSDHRSFGSSYFPSSQSRKISIGIMADASTQKRPGVTKDDRVGLTNTERKNPIDVENKGQSVIDANEGKQTEIPVLATSPWTSTRSSHQKIATSEDVLFVKENSNGLPAGGNVIKHKGRSEAQITHCQTSKLYCSDGKQKFNGFTYKRKESKKGSSQREEERTFAAGQEVFVADKAMVGNKAEGGRTENLRMKLWEILGTVSSPKSQPPNSQPCEIDVNNSKPKKAHSQEDDAAVKPSDPIETDSENPHPNMNRPVTRSLTRRRASTKVQVGKKNAGISSSYKQKLQEKNVFSFAEKLHVKGDVAADDGEPMSIRKVQKTSSTMKPHAMDFTENNNPSRTQEGLFWKGVFDVNVWPSTSTKKKDQRNSSSNEPNNVHAKNNAEDIEEVTDRSETSTKKEGQRKSSSIQPNNFLFTENRAVEIEEVTHRSKTSIAPGRTSSLSDKVRKFGHPKNMTEDLEKETRDVKRYSHQSPTADSHQPLRTQGVNLPADFHSPIVPQNGGQEEHISPSLKNVTDPPDDFQSPTFKFNTPNLTPSAISTPVPDQKKQVDHSPALEDRRSTMEIIHSFRSLQTWKANCSASTSQTESSDDEAECRDSPRIKATSVKERNEEENGLSESSSEDSDPQISKEGSPVTRGNRKKDDFSPETLTFEGSKFVLFPNKKLHSHGSNRESKLNPNFPPSKGIDESDWSPEPDHPDGNQENELERIITLFALALENFRNKMMLATRRKSSEILMSVSKEIHSKLQNIESQVQSDLSKLTSASKLKRKRVETKLQEQQEQLKMIHDKFKQDIHQQLQVCISILEELEEHQIGLKGAVKKQKASHQQLIEEVEKTVDIRLKDAQKSIAAVNKISRGKMLQLRNVVAECLNENIFS